MRFLVFAFLFLISLPVQAAEKQSAFDRVMASGTIRCSYIVYPPYIIKDANTGALSGIFHDVMEQLGHAADLKIAWTEEVGYDSLFSGLDAGRDDVFCGGLWPGVTRAKAGLFSTPIFYSIITAWARPDDHRFDADFSAINDPAIRIASIDGAMEDVIAKADFPKASRVSLPELSPFSQNLVNIATGKADVSFIQPSVARDYLAHNPGTLREVAPDRPLRTFGNSLLVGRGEQELKEFLDTGLRELLYSGRVDAILKTYDKDSGTYLRVAKPYQ